MQLTSVHLIFFLTGIVQDILITYYYQTIAREHAWRASILSTIVTLVNILVLYGILANIEEQVLSVILAFAIGNGVGTFFVMREKSLRKFLLRRK